MRNAICLLLVAFLAALQLGLAQSGEKPEHKQQAYAYGGLGALAAEGDAATISQIGGGIEARFYKGLGVAVDLGYLFPTRQVGDGFGTLSPGAVYQFSRHHQTVPFLSGGYTLGFRDETINMVHFGGGATYWFRDGIGLRIEARDYVSTQAGNAHFFMVRIGVSGR